MKAIKHWSTSVTMQHKLRMLKTGAFEMRRTLTVVSFCGVALTIMGLS